MMRYLLEKLATAVRGGTREVLETAVDANAQRILAQEIHESEIHLHQAKRHLVQVMAEKLRLQRQLEAQKQTIQEKENTIRSQLQQADEVGALALAEALVQQESWVEDLQQKYTQLVAYEQSLLQTLKAASRQLEHYRTELRMAQATTHAQQAMGKLTHQASSCSDSFVLMQDSLARVKRQQAAFNDQLQATQDIEAYLADKPSVVARNQQKASQVLARLRA